MLVSIEKKDVAFRTNVPIIYTVPMRNHEFSDNLLTDLSLVLLCR